MSGDEIHGAQGRYDPAVVYRFYVYRWRNKLNGHMYIGKGCDRRAWEHVAESKGRSPNSLIAKALKKYGVANFELTFLEEGLTDDEAKLRERYYIAKWNTCHDPDHYNLTEGGDGVSGLVMTDVAKEKIRRAMSGRTYDEEHRAKIADWNETARVGDKISKRVKGIPKSDRHIRNATDPQRRKELKALIPEMRQLREAGHSYNEIGDRFGVSGRWVYVHLR